LTAFVDFGFSFVVVVVVTAAAVAIIVVAVVVVMLIVLSISLFCLIPNQNFQKYENFTTINSGRHLGAFFKTAFQVNFGLFDVSVLRQIQ